MARTARSHVLHEASSAATITMRASTQPADHAATGFELG